MLCGAEVARRAQKMHALLLCFFGRARAYVRGLASDWRVVPDWVGSALLELDHRLMVSCILCACKWYLHDVCFRVQRCETEHHLSNMIGLAFSRTKVGWSGGARPRCLGVGMPCH